VVLGGVTGDPAPERGGSGGEGRVRVDGLDGVTDIPGALTSEYVGPAIVDVNGSGIVGRGNATSDFEAKIWNGTAFNNFTATSDANGDFTIPVTFDADTNYVAVIQNTTNNVFVLSSAATWIVYTRSMEDSATIDDSIGFKITRTTEDSVTVDDFITAVLMSFRTTEDIITIDDSISFIAFIRLTDGVKGDSATIAEKASAKSFFLKEDSATIDDFITTKTSSCKTS